MVASLPLFEKVAVPQLVMKIAATQSKTFRAKEVEFIWRFFSGRCWADASPPVKTSTLTACSRSEADSFDVSDYCSLHVEAVRALVIVQGEPNAARFMTIMTSAKRYNPIINPMAACITRMQTSQTRRVRFNQMKTG